MNTGPRGYTLPFVLLALAAASVLAFSLASEGWRSAQATSLAVQGDAGANASEEAEAMALAAWDTDSLWRFPLGEEHRRELTTPLGQAVRISWRRTHPLIAWLQTNYRVNGNARQGTLHRSLSRAIWLQAPPVPLPAALNMPGDVTGAGATVVSGIDIVRADSPCGLVRDTASVQAVQARSVVGDPAGTWPDAPVPVAPARWAYDSIIRALPDMQRRSARQVPGVSPLVLPSGGGWRALWLTGPQVTLDGPTHWTGLLVVDGNLVLRGAVTLEGLLVVRGDIDARAAHWVMRGAVTGADSVTGSARLGTHTTVQYDRCAMQMALATVARPQTRPFSLWQPLSP